MKRILATLAVVLALVIVGHPSDPLLSAQSADGHTAMYSVKVTNLTTAQFFAPLLVVTHAPSMNLFLPGTQASEELRAMAEVGNVEPLMMMLDGMMGVMDVQMTGMTMPGVTTEIMISGMYGYRLSLVSMLIPTNDAFLGANMMLPGEGGMMGYANAYDAGTEMNDEMCSSIPNPPPTDWAECGGMLGAGARIGMGEGGIVISNGINGQGDFMPMMRDWKNPVARITITKM
jgi:hypothetical protein